MPVMPAISRRNAVLAVYRTHEEANSAVRTLMQHGHDHRRFSLVTRDRLSSTRIVMDDHGEGAITPWGKLGVFGPGLWGLVMGWTSLWVPGLGPLLIGGPLVSELLGSHDGAAVFGALTPLGVGLHRMGVPKGSSRRYEEIIRKGRYLLVISGPVEEVTRAGRLLSSTGAEIVALHARVEPAKELPAPASGLVEQSVAAGRPDRIDQPFPLAEPDAGA